ncbi:MAG: phosphotransferase family protein [Anaerolineae bacterium]
MQSATKIKLGRETVARLLRAHFGADAELAGMAELDEGYFNTAYRLDLADGRAWVLKVAPPADVVVLQYEAEIMGVEVAVMRLLRERTSLPVPAIHCYDRSCALIANEFYLMDYVEGTPLHQVRQQLSLEEQFEIDRQLGRYLREVHAITNTTFGYYAPCQPRFESWRGAFGWMVQCLLEDGQARDVALPLSYPQLYRRLEAHFPLLEEVTVSSLVLWDVWDGNVFVDSGANKITGIIDYERSLWGDPLMEMTFGWYDPDGGFAEGYAKRVLQTSSEQVRRRLYSIYLFLIMIIECYYRHYPSDGQETWARRKLAEELDKLPQ